MNTADSKADDSKFNGGGTPDAAIPLPPSRVDSFLNDPAAAAHPEHAKADEAMADELQALQVVLDKTALRKLSIKQAEEAKIVADTLRLNAADARTQQSDPKHDANDSTSSTEEQDKDEGAANARVAIDAQHRRDPDQELPANAHYSGPGTAFTGLATAQRAQAFQNEHDPVAGTKGYPELAGAYAVVAAIDRKAKLDGLSPQAREVVAARVRENIVASLKRDELPRMDVIDHRNPPHRSPDRLVQR